MSEKKLCKVIGVFFVQHLTNCSSNPLPPTADVCEIQGCAVPQGPQTRWQPLGFMTSPFSHSIDGFRRKWSSGDILKGNLWTADMSMTGSAWQHIKSIQITQTLIPWSREEAGFIRDSEGSGLRPPAVGLLLTYSGEALSQPQLEAFFF